MSDHPITSSERERLEEERLRLLASNEAATGWGAAVGARCERILEIDRQLRRDVSVPTPAVCEACGTLSCDDTCDCTRLGDPELRKPIDAVDALQDIVKEQQEDIADLLARVERLTAALRGLVFAARTSGGVAGRDAGLCAACDKAEVALSPVEQDSE